MVGDEEGELGAGAGMHGGHFPGYTTKRKAYGFDEGFWLGVDADDPKYHPRVSKDFLRHSELSVPDHHIHGRETVLMHDANAQEEE